MIRKQSRREWSDKMSDIQNERLIEFISNSKVAFINGQFQEAFNINNDDRLANNTITFIVNIRTSDC